MVDERTVACGYAALRDAFADQQRYRRRPRRALCLSRVLTNYTFKALIFDFIVANTRRGTGFGDRLMSLIKGHRDLHGIKHFELYCLPEIVPFYERHGFSSDVGGIELMRLTTQ